MYRTVSLTNQQFQYIDMIAKRLGMPKGQMLYEATQELVASKQDQENDKEIKYSGNTFGQVLDEIGKDMDDFFARTNHPRPVFDLDFSDLDQYLEDAYDEEYDQIINAERI